jgi:hypothetical protein
MPGKEGRPFKYSKPDGSLDIEAIRQKAENYINDKTNTKRSVPGLCLALDITKETLNMWEQGITDDREDEEKRPYYDELSLLIKKAKLEVEKYLIENDGKNAIKDLAALNASFGYKQASEQNINVNANIKLIPGKLDELSR